MGIVFRANATAGVALIGAALIAATPATPAPPAQVRTVRLTGDTADSPLGGGTALVIGGSGTPIPSQSYVDTANALYLAPRGYTGDAQPLFTPEGLQPDTGVKTLPFDTSEAQGQQILDSAILNQIADGHVDAANPVVVFGWSQSSVISSLLMSQLQAQGVPSGDVHFVLVGNESAPNGGVLERADFPINGESPTVPSLGITFSGAMPSDLYPTDNYTVEYDGFADFPQYTTNLISDLNAIAGIVFAHGEYMGFTAKQLLPVADGGEAIQLPTSAADTLANYYMIPNPELPLLEPLQLVPVIGQPLYDLLEPDTRILVNLGYGSITDGWSPGGADVPTIAAPGLFPPGVNPVDVLTALGSGLHQGVTAAVEQLENPDNYKPVPIDDNPALSVLLRSQALAGPGLNAPTPPPTPEPLSLTDIVNDFSGKLSGLYATLLSDADTANALLTVLPADLATVFAQELEAGNLVDAIGLPIAAATALIPFAIAFGVLSPLPGVLGISI